jgi:integrase
MNPPAITADGIYKMVQHYAKRVRVNTEGFGAHSLRATAATNALDHEADIAKVQEGSDMPTLPPHGSMTGGRRGRRTARRLR